MSHLALREAASRLLRRGQAEICRRAGRTDRALRDRRDQALVLCYHRVLPDRRSARGVEPGMYVAAGTFDRHLAWLTERFRVRTLGELLDEGPDRAESGKPAAAITFDDGWRDNLTEAWPLLERRGLRATIFLVSDWVERGRTPAGEFLRPDDVRRLADAGMEFGAHTVTHPSLPELAPDAIRGQMTASRDAVARWTGRDCTLFAYPYGRCDARSADIARSTFRASVVLSGRWWSADDDAARTPRIGIHEDMTSARSLFEATIAGLFRRGGGAAPQAETAIS